MKTQIYFVEFDMLKITVMHTIDRAVQAWGGENNSIEKECHSSEFVGYFNFRGISSVQHIEYRVSQAATPLISHICLRNLLTFLKSQTKPKLGPAF